MVNIPSGGYISGSRDERDGVNRNVFGKLKKTTSEPAAYVRIQAAAP
jgi:hypothetical protein